MLRLDGGIVQQTSLSSIQRTDIDQHLKVFPKYKKIDLSKKQYFDTNFTTEGDSNIESNNDKSRNLQLTTTIIDNIPDSQKSIISHKLLSNSKEKNRVIENQKNVKKTNSKDLKLVKKRINNSINSVKNEMTLMKSEMILVKSEMKSEMKNEMTLVKSEIKNEMNLVKNAKHQKF